MVMEQDKSCYICGYIFEQPCPFDFGDKTKVIIFNLTLCGACTQRILKWFADKVREDFSKDK